MNRAAISIPEKLFFKIGEVCEICGVQAHVLRYWESEFPMLAPQKNRAGQRTYRKRDVEMVLHIKELLYEDQYTIAGAKKKLTNDLRGASKLKVVTPEMSAQAPGTSSTPQLVPPAPEPPAEEALPAHAVRSRDITVARESAPEAGVELSDDRREALRRLRQQMRDLLSLLDSDETRSNARR